MLGSFLLWLKAAGICYMFALDRSRDHPEWSGQVFRTKSFDLPLKKNRQKQFKIMSVFR